MAIIKAIIMGLIQGLTEFLPVSSSGHLAIVGQLLKLELDDGAFFEILLHFGTLMAVFIAFRKDVLALIVDTDNKKFVILIIVSSIPTVILAFTLENFINSSFTILLVPAIGLMVTGLLLLSTKFIKEGSLNAGNTGYLRAIIIGVAQGIATIPGISRSGSTLVASLLLKLDRAFAIKYSFIMSIPVILGATLVKALEVDFSAVGSTQILSYLIGTIVAGTVGYICIRTLLIIINRNKLHYFAYYCFTIGILAMAGYFMI
jgi:undecaprenyl-diphosphatase